MNELGGIIPAVVTPMTADGGPDMASFERQVGYLADSGVHGFLINGTTGEGPYLGLDEQKACLAVAGSARKKEQFLSVAAIAQSTREVVHAIRELEALEPDYFVVVPPYYFGLDAAAMEQHFLTVAAATERPIILYNIPQRTVNDLFDGCVDALVRTGRFSGLKDSSGDFARFAQRVYAGTGRFKWIQGEDLLDVPSLLAGAAGVVTGLGNLFPEIYTRMAAAVRALDLQAATECQRRINALAGIIDAARGKVIPAIKYGLSLLGRCQEWSRLERSALPLVSKTRIEAIVRGLQAR